MSINQERKYSIDSLESIKLGDIPISYSSESLVDLEDKSQVKPQIRIKQEIKKNNFLKKRKRQRYSRQLVVPSPKIEDILKILNSNRFINNENF